MKNLYKILVSLVVIAGINSCTSDGDIDYVLQSPEATFSIKSPLGGSSLVLNDANPSNTALTLVWEDTKSSEDGVTYTVQFALPETAFANPIIAGTSNVTNANWSVGDLNTIFLDEMKLPHSVESPIEVRVLASNEEVSNVITLIVTPHVQSVSELYLNGSFTNWDPTQSVAMTMDDFNIFSLTYQFADGDEFNFIESNTNDDITWQLVTAGSTTLTKYGGENISGFVGKFAITVNLITNTITMKQIFTPDALFLVGSFVGWDIGASLPFTKNGDIFTVNVVLSDGDEIKFVQSNSSWDGDWGEDPNNPGNIIQEGEKNVTGISAGKYKVTVNFSTLTYTMELVTSPDNLYLVGSMTGWDPATSVPFAKTSENVFTVVYNLPDGAEFKFLEIRDWAGDWGEDPNNAGSIIQEGEKNVSGYAGGKYLITVDYNTQTYNLKSVDKLYLVGSLTGWDPPTSIPMGEASLGVFSTIIDLPDGAEFKFLPQNTGWDGDWGEDPNNAGRVISEGEVNAKGFSAGKYVISVDFNTLSFKVSSVTGIPSALYLVGSFNGWSNDSNNPQFTETSTGVFEITQTLSAGDEYKFVPVAGDWGNDWGESQASKGVLEQNSEKNVSASTGGNYTIIVDFNNGTITATL